MKNKMKCFLLIVFIAGILTAQSEVQIVNAGFTNENSALYLSNTKKAELSVSQNGRSFVFGFLPWWVTPSDSDLSIRFDLLTHLGIAGFDADSSGNLIEHDVTWKSLINSAVENDVKLIMVVANFNPDEIHSLFSDTLKRNNLFEKIGNVVHQNKFNGVMIDFEYINEGEDRQSLFTNFLKLLKENLADIPGLELSAALPAVTGDSWDLQGITDICDYVLIMGYDFYGKWSSTTGPTAPLTGQYWFLKNSINEDYKNIPADKLILGVPYYGNLWKTKSGEPYAEVIPFEDKNEFNDWQEIVIYKNIFNKYPGFEKLIDTISSTSWMRYKQNDTTWFQLWCDDSSSLALKYDFVLEKNLKGIGIWALGYDGGRTELWDLINEKFVNPVSVINDQIITGNYKLYQNYPNPFNPSTVISYQLPSYGFVRLKIFDILGREVASLVDEYQSAGIYQIVFNGNQSTFNGIFTSGIYFYSLRAGNYFEVNKMIYLK